MSVAPSIGLPWVCGTCERPFPATEHSNREPGWEPEDVDCDECYRTWPEREQQALVRKKA